MSKIANRDWDVDLVLSYLGENCPAVEADNEGQIVLYTGLFEWPDRTLHTEPNESWKDN